MPTPDRELGRNGPVFFKDTETGDVMFQYGVDANNVIGPYKATKADKVNHKGAWESFAAEQSKGDHHPASDGDGDGKPGGSLPTERETEPNGEPPAPQGHGDDEVQDAVKPVEPKRRPGRPRKA